MCKTHRTKYRHMTTGEIFFWLTCLFFTTEFQWYPLLSTDGVSTQIKSRVAWCTTHNRLQLCMVGTKDWETRRMLTPKSLMPVSFFFFFLQKSKTTHVTPHAIPVLSMYEIHLCGGEGEKKGISCKAKRIGHLALYEDFSAARITLVFSTTEIKSNVNVTYLVKRSKSSKSAC